MADLAGRTAIVTGGGTGIGEACAWALSAAGAAALVADIDEPSAHAVAEQISAGGVRAEAHRADVTIADEVDEMVEYCLADFGALNVAVNNAGIHGDPANPPVADYPLDWWDRILATNLSSIFYCLAAEIRAIRETGEGGSIINMASIFGQVAAPGLAGYTAAKHGVNTGLVERNVPEAERRNVAALHALNRLGEPREIADLVTFHAGDGASFLTGAYYPAEDGFLAR